MKFSEYMEKKELEELPYVNRKNVSNVQIILKDQENKIKDLEVTLNNVKWATFLYMLGSAFVILFLLGKV